MKTVGLITEYNPFHKGHAWHLQEAKRLSGAEYCIVIMSGNFVQRGGPAIIDKYTRTEMALSGGADLVLELPVPYATGSAEYFAAGAVTLLDSLNTVETLCFGSECADLDPLLAAARLLNEEPEDFRIHLKENLRNGSSFPLARAEAIKTYLHNCPDEKKFNPAILNQPNNILGIEYLKALEKYKSSMQPLTIPRIGGGYHEESLNDTLSSATSIRKILLAPKRLIQNLPDPTSLLFPLQNEMPQAAYEILKRSFGTSCPVSANDFSEILHYCLLQMTASAELMDFQDITPEIADRIYRLIPSYEDFDRFTVLIKGKQYTQTRIRRCLLHVMLNIRKEPVNKRIAKGWHSCLRVLGFKRSSAALLGEIKRKSGLPLITKLADASRILDANAMADLNSDILSSSIYQSIVTHRYSHQAYNEYTKQLVIR